MAKGRFISYLRVSTDRQGRSGLGLEAQRKAVRTTSTAAMEARRRVHRGRERQAEATARSSPRRSRLCRLHGAKLVIAKLDRLARNVAFISNLMESGVDFVAVDFPQANRLTVTSSPPSPSTRPR